MTIYVENETDFTFPFDTKELCSRVAEAVLDAEGCPYETEINVLITDNEGIRLYNKEYRNIDRETDVLSFPNIPFETEADFSIVEENCSDYFQPDSGELILGDIILSVDRICSQAESYGHSRKREFAFLVAHSMLHLCGYDHETPEEAAVMEQKQQVLSGQHCGTVRLPSGIFSVQHRAGAQFFRQPASQKPPEYCIPAPSGTGTLFPQACKQAPSF